MYYRWATYNHSALLLTAGNPPLFENTDPEPPKGFEKPSLPEDYDLFKSRREDPG